MRAQLPDFTNYLLCHIICISDVLPIGSGHYPIRQRKPQTNRNLYPLDVQFSKVYRVVYIVQADVQIVVVCNLTPLVMFIPEYPKGIVYTLNIEIHVLEIGKLLPYLPNKLKPVIARFQRNNHLHTIALLCGMLMQQVNAVVVLTLVHHILAFHSILPTDEIECGGI